ncbi:hypothetical protein FPV67DRAFT_216855 [Lyophyllum atratum]|nr:hypothetical protein FPV67DRAFT_216855 [Lyophyllum atratum]
MAADFVFIDDNSASVIYTSGWSAAGTPNEYGGTTHGARIGGSQATITFVGSSVEVYGTIGLENNGNSSFAPVSSYTVDGDSRTTNSFTAALGDVVLYKQPFYTFSGLAAGQQHELVLTYVTSGKNPLWLDYVRVGRELDTQPSSQPTPPTVPQSSPQPSSQPTSSSSSQSRALSDGAIAGIAIGGFIAVCLVVAIILLLRSLSRRPNAPAPERGESRSRWPWDSSPPGPTTVTPFDLPTDATSSRPSQNTDPSLLHQRQPSSSGSGSAAGLGHHQQMGYTTRGGTFTDKAGPHTHTPPPYG